MGVLTALAADGPEISSALAALAKGAHSASVGVLVGSNVFNLAAMIGLSAIVAREVRVRAEAAILEGSVSLGALLIAAAVLFRWVIPGVGLFLLAMVLVPYVILLFHGNKLLGRVPVPRRFAERLERALAQHARGARPNQPEATAGLVVLMVLDVALVIGGSIGMVTAALSLGSRWHVSEAVIGVLVLAPLTSIPNALTAVRLGLAGRGSALVSEAFNSNTINLTAGLVIPALFVLPPPMKTAGAVDLAWLLVMSVLSVALLARRNGLRRSGGALLVLLYGGFVAVHLAFG